MKPVAFCLLLVLLGCSSLSSATRECIETVLVILCLTLSAFALSSACVCVCARACVRAWGGGEGGVRRIQLQIYDL